MLPGPALDLEVAKNVFGYAVILDTATNVNTIWHKARNEYVPVPQYSTILELGHMVLTEMTKKGWDCNISSEVGEEIVWRAQFARRGHKAPADKGQSIPHAICRAALTAIQTIKDMRV